MIIPGTDRQTPTERLRDDGKGAMRFAYYTSSKDARKWVDCAAEMTGLSRVYVFPVAPDTNRKFTSRGIVGNEKSTQSHFSRRRQRRNSLVKSDSNMQYRTYY